VSLNNNTTDVTSVAETSNPSKAPELISVINGVRVCQFLDFCVVFCRSANMNKRYNQFQIQFVRVTSVVIIKVITKLPNSEQSYKGKVKTHKYINRQNQSPNNHLRPLQED
jgi:hypothetical protein